MIDRSRLGVAGVAGGVLMTLLTLVFLLTPRAHSFNIAGVGTYAVYADLDGGFLGIAALPILDSTDVTDPNSGTADTAASPEPGETQPAERHSHNGLPIEVLNVQKRFNMSNAPGGAGLGNWTLVIRAGSPDGAFTNIQIDVVDNAARSDPHFCVIDLFNVVAGLEPTNILMATVTLNAVDIRMRQGGYFAPVTAPTNDPPCAAPPV